MAEYKGSLLQVYFNTVDISATGRSVNVSEDAGEPEEIDITHRGDTERQVLESFPGRQACTVDVTLLDDDGGASTIYGFAINAKDTLFVYPEGSTAGNRKGQLNNTRLIQRSLTTPYDGAVEVSVQFHAKNSITWTTLATA
jgi:hypothetical protein